MKKLVAVAGMLMLFAAPLFAQDKAAPAVDTAAPAADAPAAAPKKAAKKAGGDEAGIKAGFERFSKAWAAGDAEARAACFTPDATLINPFGVAANGRAEIVKLFEQENATIAKGTTHTFDNYKFHFIMPNLALVDCDGTISGIKTPAGTDAPDVKLHVYGVLVKRTKDWQMLAARPAIYAPMPGAPAADAAAPASPSNAAASAKAPDDSAVPTVVAK